MTAASQLTLSSSCQSGPVAQLLRHPPPQMAKGPADRLHLAEDVGVEPGAARIANLLFPLGDIEQRLRHASSGAEQVDLEDDHVLARPGSLQHIFKRRVGDELRSTRLSGGLPAMMAELTAPIEMPATQLGMCPASHRAA